MLTRDRILSLFAELDHELRGSGVHGHVFAKVGFFLEELLANDPPSAG